MNIWLSSLRIRAHLSWRTGKHLHVLHVLRTYSTCSYPGYQDTTTYAALPTNMSSVTIPVLMYLVWSDIGSNKLEKSLSSVTSATILVLRETIWLDTSVLTLEKNPTPAINVVSQAKILVTFRSTWRGRTESNQMLEITTCLPGLHFSLDMLPSWADRGSCAHKCVC